jgi:hypothetical protein
LTALGSTSTAILKLGETRIGIFVESHEAKAGANGRKFIAALSVSLCVFRHQTRVQVHQPHWSGVKRPWLGIRFLGLNGYAGTSPSANRAPAGWRMPCGHRRPTSDVVPLKALTSTLAIASKKCSPSTLTVCGRIASRPSAGHYRFSSPGWQAITDSESEGVVLGTGLSTDPEPCWARE